MYRRQLRDKRRLAMEWQHLGKNQYKQSRGHGRGRFLSLRGLRLRWHLDVQRQHMGTHYHKQSHNYGGCRLAPLWALRDKRRLAMEWQHMEPAYTGKSLKYGDTLLRSNALTEPVWRKRGFEIQMYNCFVEFLSVPCDINHLFLGR